MKIRSNYVSNSSSSSFVIISDELGTIEEVNIEDLDFGNKRYLMIGKMLSDGVDLIDLNEEMFQFIKEHPKIVEEFDCDQVLENISEGEYDVEIDTRYLVNITDKVSIKSGYVDYHCSENIEDLIQNYIGS